MADEEKKDPFVIRTADFTTPPRYPFESRKGVFHPYHYVPFLGWIPQTEFMILIVVASVVAVLTIPHLRRHKAAVPAEAAPAAALAAPMDTPPAKH